MCEIKDFSEIFYVSIITKFIIILKFIKLKYQPGVIKLGILSLLQVLRFELKKFSSIVWFSLLRVIRVNINLYNISLKYLRYGMFK